MTLYLVTRPQPDAEKTARLLEAAGYTAMVAPMLEITPATEAPQLLPPLLTDQPVILITSANGVRALATLTANRDMPLLTVGQASANTAQSLGFIHVTPADATLGGDVHGLHQHIRQHYRPGTTSFLHISGQETAGDLHQLLQEDGYQASRCTAYRAIPTPALPAAVQDGLHQKAFAGIVFYSPRTAQRWMELVAHHQLTESLRHSQAYCLSARVRDALQPLLWQSCHVAAYPTQDALLALIAEKNRL